MGNQKRMHRRKKTGKFLIGALLLSVFAGFLNPRTKEGEKWRAAGNSQEMAGQPEKEMFFALTKEEEDYLAGLRDTPLFLGVCETGMWEEQGDIGYGLAAPLLDVLRCEFGLEIGVVQGTWKKNIAALKAGELDFIIGVPAVSQQGTKDGEPDAKDILYSGEWLYEKPYALIEYIGETSSAKDKKENDKIQENSDEESGETAKTMIAYVAKNPVVESILLHVSGIFDARGDNVSAKNIDFFPCKNEDAVFNALRNGSATVGLLPEDALFLCYPETDFSVISNLSQYESAAALGTADKELCPLLEILNRYLDTTQEGDMLREAIRIQQQSARQEQIWKKEEEIIKNLQGQGKELFYAQTGLDAVPFYWHDELGAHGILSDFLKFVEEGTGLVFKEDSRSGEKALQALEDGEILFAAGMTPGDGQAYCPVICIKQRLVPVVFAKEIEEFSITHHAIEIRYWGAVQEWMPLLAGTAFDGHTVEFSDEEGLYQAMQAGSIGGMLISQESFDALLLSGEYSYAVVEGISFETRGGLTFLNGNKDVAALFLRLWQFYNLFQKERENAAEQYRAAYGETAVKQKELVSILWILGTATFIFAMAFLLSVRSGKRRRRREQE